MNKLRAAIVLVGLATLLACGGDRDDSSQASARPDPPPAIADILNVVEGETAVTWQQFEELAKWHRTLRNWPPSDSRLLLHIGERDEKLADALLLYRDSDLETSVESAFVQYLTSTPKPVPPSAAHPDAEMWAQNYANRLSVAWPPAKGSFGLPYFPADDLESLKSKLILINRVRYGWDEVIPASIFAFSDNEKFNKQNAMWMAEMAALAYHSEAAVRAQLNLWGFAVDSSFKWLDNIDTGTQGFVVWNNSRMVVSFRGTKGFADMATDLMIKRDQVPWVAGGVHRGFSRAIDSVWKDVETVVGNELGNRKLFVTGHSLGAALAQLAAIRLKGSGEDVTAVYAFGSPFIGDDKFAKAYDSALAQRTFLHINHKDAVTRIPPRWLGFTPVATASSWLFVGAGHKMARLMDADESDVSADSPVGMTEQVVESMIDDLDNPDNDEVIRSWFAEADQDLRVANEFISLSPELLTAGSYDQTFETGRVDDHGINQYVFKLGCALLEERWQEETSKAKDESTGQ
ncbi:MAG: lipase family protein [Gammaproteobacteria bacterium]